MVGLLDSKARARRIPTTNSRATFDARRRPSTGVALEGSSWSVDVADDRGHLTSRRYVCSAQYGHENYPVDEEAVTFQEEPTAVLLDLDLERTDKKIHDDPDPKGPGHIRHRQGNA